MKPRVLVTRQVFDELVERLAKVVEVDHNASDDILDPATLRQRAAGCAGVLGMLSDRFDEAFFQACPSVKVVSNIAVGYNNIDVAAATRHGVVVTNTPGVLDETTADLTFALLMATARRITEAEAWLREGHWKKGFALQQMLGTDIHHTKLGIIGMGRIGQAVARRAAGFAMQVSYHNRTRLDAATEARLGATWVSREQLLTQSDFVVLMVPYSPTTHHLIGAAELALMKPGAILINTARGGVVDDAALIAALQSGRLAGAGLDVFENEPTLNPQWLTLKNVVLTPHIGSATQATRRSMVNLAADNLCAALRGERPPNAINDVVKT